MTRPRRRRTLRRLLSLSTAVFAALSATVFASAAASPAAAQETLRLTGELVSPVRSDLVARQAGRIEKVLVDEGDVVRRGQELLRLESTYLQLDVHRAEAALKRAAAALADAERDLERKEQLIAKGSVSQAVHDRATSAFDQTAAAHELALSEVAVAEQRLEDAVLRAPLDGVVAERKVEVGEYLGQQSAAFVIVKTAPLELHFQVPERHLPQIRKGGEVRADFDPYPGEIFRAEITRIDPVIDPQGRSFTVEAVLDNADGRLKPGLFARVEVAPAE